MRKWGGAGNPGFGRAWHASSVQRSAAQGDISLAQVTPRNHGEAPEAALLPRMLRRHPSGGGPLHPLAAWRRAAGVAPGSRGGRVPASIRRHAALCYNALNARNPRKGLAPDCYLRIHNSGAGAAAHWRC
jgi:hypothetical protein